MKNINKEEIYFRFLNFCKEHPIGLPSSIVIEFNQQYINELITEGRLIKHTMGIGGEFYTLTDNNGKPIYKRSW